MVELENLSEKNAKIYLEKAEEAGDSERLKNRWFVSMEYDKI